MFDLTGWQGSLLNAKDVADGVKMLVARLRPHVDHAGQMALTADEFSKYARNTKTRTTRPRFQCSCGRAHHLGDDLLECECGAQYHVEWSGDGCRVVDMPAAATA